MKTNVIEWKSNIIQFFQRETVFCVSLVLALLSALVVPPDGAYLAYPDYRTLSLLFCLMIIVAGFRSLGIFERLGQALLRRTGWLRSLSIVLVLLCFFSSMIITNDVSLITFVPFTLLVFRMIGREEKLLHLVVLETIAANLGSMATPIGNPQNLYLFSHFQLSPGEFAWAVLPYTGLALVLLLLALWTQGDDPIQAEASLPHSESSGHLTAALIPYLALLVLCLLVVFRVLSYLPVLVCVAVVILVVNRSLFTRVDYYLLFTFLFFFVFIGNLKRIPALNDLLLSLVQSHELIAGILTSQVISNVPAAILLSGFTDQCSPLLTGVNLGGLGTLIASLASLIAFKFYGAEYPRQKGTYLLVFTLWNVGFLVLLTALALFLA